MLLTAAVGRVLLDLLARQFVSAVPTSTSWIRQDSKPRDAPMSTSAMTGFLYGWWVEFCHEHTRKSDGPGCLPVRRAHVGPDGPTDPGGVVAPDRHGGDVHARGAPVVVEGPAPQTSLVPVMPPGPSSEVWVRLRSPRPRKHSLLWSPGPPPTPRAMAVAAAPSVLTPLPMRCTSLSVTPAPHSPGNAPPGPRGEPAVMATEGSPADDFD